MCGSPVWLEQRLDMGLEIGLDNAEEDTDPAWEPPSDKVAGPGPDGSNRPPLTPRGRGADPPPTKEDGGGPGGGAGTGPGPGAGGHLGGGANGA